MKIWVTKYALTKGLYQIDADLEGPYWAEKSESAYRLFLRNQHDAFMSRAVAVSRAKKMRDAKIASLRKQIARLEALRFDV